MDFKMEKGITLVALILTVVVMLILIRVGIEFGGDAISKAKIEDIKTDMISIKTKAKIVAEQYNFKDIDILVGNAITNEEANKIGIANNDKLLKWSIDDLKNQNLSRIEGDIYVVQYDLDNPNNCEVYYLKGYEGIYSLTELQGL